MELAPTQLVQAIFEALCEDRTRSEGARKALRDPHDDSLDEFRDHFSNEVVKASQALYSWRKG